MKDDQKSKSQLIADLQSLRLQLAQDVSEPNQSTNNALLIEKDKLKSILDAMVDGVTIIGENHTIQYLNPALEKAFGEPEGRKCYEYFHRKKRACSNCMNSEVFSGKVKRWEWYSKKTGKTYDLIDTPLKNFDGSVSKLEIFRDVTDKKWAEKELKKSRQRYQLATNAGQVGVWDWNLETHEVYLDSCLKALFGYEQSETCNNFADWEKFVHPDDVALLRNKVIDHLEGRSPYFEATHRVVHKDGSVRWMHARGTAIYDSDGKAYRVVGTSNDITGRKLAQDMLKNRTRELSLLNSAGKALVSSLELDQVLATLLDEVQEIIGLTSCSIWLTDKEDGELVCQEAASQGNQEVRGNILAQSKSMVEWVVQHGKCLNVPDLRCARLPFRGIAAAPDLHLRSILCLLLQTKNGIVGALHLGDKTENRFDSDDIHLAESLAAMAAIAIDNARLYRQTREDAKTKDLLLREVNHRVKNNLAAISGMLYIEQRYIQEPSVERGHGGMLNDLTNRIKALSTVHQLLSDSRWSPLSLRDLVLQVSSSALQVFPQDRQVLVKVTSTDQVTVTPRDAHNLAIVVNELATNVIKYAAPDRDVTQVSVDISKETDSGYIRLIFRDDGPGFPDTILRGEGRRVGTYLMENTVCHSLRGKIEFYNDQGAVVSIQFIRDLE